MTGGATLAPVMARYPLDNQRNYKPTGSKETLLSPCEMEILTLLADGLPQKQIAEGLSISPKTVDFHVGHIYKKLNVQNAPSAVAQAYKTGLFPRKK